MQNNMRLRVVAEELVITGLLPRPPAPLTNPGAAEKARS